MASSASGDILYVSGAGVIYGVDSTGTVTELIDLSEFEPRISRCSTLELAPDRQSLLVWTDAGIYRVEDIQTDPRLNPMPVIVRPFVTNFAVDPGTGDLFLAAFGMDILRINSTDGDSTRFVAGLSVHDLAFGPSSDRQGMSLYATTHDGIVEISGFAGGSEGPAIHAVVDTVDFGDVSLSGRSVRQITVFNVGRESLRIESVLTDVPFSSNISSAVVPPHGRQIVEVAFAPLDEVRSTGVLSISSNDPGRPTVEIGLQGRGVTLPDIEVSPSTLDLRMNAGDSTETALVIANRGPGDLAFAIEFQVEGDSSGVSGFIRFRARLFPAAGRISAGDSVRVRVEIEAPGFARRISAGLVVTSNDPDEGEVRVALGLTAVGIPRMSVPLNNLNFGRVVQGGRSTRTLSVDNFGTDSLRITELEVETGPFSVGLQTLVIAPRDSGRVTVTFAPVQPGLAVGVLAIGSNDPNRPSLEIVLQGRGVPPPDIQVSPGSFEFQALAGEAVLDTLVVSNTGEGTLEFHLQAIDSSTIEGRPLRIMAWTVSSDSVAPNIREVLSRQGIDFELKTPAVIDTMLIEAELAETDLVLIPGQFSSIFLDGFFLRNLLLPFVQDGGTVLGLSFFGSSILRQYCGHFFRGFRNNGFRNSFKNNIYVTLQLFNQTREIG